MGELNKTGGRDGPAESAVKLLPPISKHTVDLLLQLEHPRDPIALYVFYLYVATWQRTNRPKATTRFCADRPSYHRGANPRRKEDTYQVGSG